MSPLHNFPIGSGEYPSVSICECHDTLPSVQREHISICGPPFRAIVAAIGKKLSAFSALSQIELDSFVECTTYRTAKRQSRWANLASAYVPAIRIGADLIRHVLTMPQSDACIVHSSACSRSLISPVSGPVRPFRWGARSSDLSSWPALKHSVTRGCT